MTNKAERPNIVPERSTFEKVLQAVGILLLIGFIALFSAVFASLPKTVPTHFNFSGVPDSYGSKFRLLTLPIMSVGLYILITVLERYPRTYNFPFEITEKNAECQYRIARETLVMIKVEMVGTFAYLSFATIKTAKGQWRGLGDLHDFVILGVLFATIAVSAYRMYKHKDG